MVTPLDIVTFGHASLYQIICSRLYANVALVNNPNNLASNDLRSAYNREVLSIASANVNTPTRRRPVIDRSYHTDLCSWNVESHLETWCAPILFPRETGVEKRFAQLVRRIGTNSSDQRVPFIHNRKNIHMSINMIFGNCFVLMSKIIIYTIDFPINCFCNLF